MGAPRGGPQGNGVVYVVRFDGGTENVERAFKLTGRQSGEYFGASLASADMNGDGVDEIIVGAPLYATLNARGGENVHVRAPTIFHLLLKLILT